MSELKQLLKFKQLLDDYQPSSGGLKLLEGLNLVILNGPSAAGRNTIINQLVSRDDYRFIVSDTTREPRFNNGIKEEDGVNYWFRSEAEVLDDLKSGQFLEAEIIHNQQVSGISLRELKKAKAASKIAVTDIEIGGFNRIMTLKPDTHGILILPPSFEQWLVRLFGRGKMTTQEIINRLKTGKYIFAQAATNPKAQIVINDQLERAVREVDGLARGKELKDQSFKLALAKSLLDQTANYLSRRFKVED